MMNPVKTICMAFSTYSRIPMPQMKWEDKNADYVICFYPLVGLVVGLAEAVWFRFAATRQFPPVVTALLMIALPIMISGGIHLDGLVDTADARHSYLPKEEKLRILKDPHVGAFGVIRLLLYLLLMAAVLILLADRKNMGFSVWLAAIPFWCRILTAFTVVWFPKAKKDGMLQAVSGGKQKIQTILLLVHALICLGAVLAAYPVPAEGIRLACMIALQLLLLLWYKRMALKEFGGVTGDLAGWLLCMLELLSVTCLLW